MCKSVTLPLKLNMSSESIRMDCSFGPRLGLIFLAFHFICVALSFLFCPCRLFFKFDHPSCGSLFNIMCTEAGKCCVPKRKRTRERGREWGWDMGVHISLWGSCTVWWEDTVYDLALVKESLLLCGFWEEYQLTQECYGFAQVMFIYWILNSFSKAFFPKNITRSSCGTGWEQGC